MATHWLDDEEQRTWRALIAVVQKLPAALDSRLLRTSGLSHFSYWVLAMLSEAPDRSLRMAELAAFAHASASRLSHVAGRLEQDGLIVREKVPGDARGARAVLTPAGLLRLEGAAPTHVAQVRSLVFEALDPGQVEMLGEICRALGAALDAPPEQAP